MTEVKLPELAEGVTKAVIAFWNKNVGDEVSEGEDIVELVTEKATFNMPSPARGTVKEIRAEEGAEVSVGDIIAVIE